MEKAALGRAAVLPVVEQLQAGGATSLREIAASLNVRGGDWSAVQVKRILDKSTEMAAA
jgi:hypothetical protein